MFKRRLILTAVLVAAVCGALLLVLTLFVFPVIKYNKAIEYLNNGNYLKSASLFKQLGNFKDSEDKFKAFKIVYKTKKEIEYSGDIWVSKYTYDEMGNVTSERSATTNSNIAEYSYEYDSKGNIIRKDTKYPKSDYDFTVRYEYYYGDNGEITSAFEIHNPGDAVFRRYDYDKNGNCIKESAGNGEFVVEYKYDLRGRLKRKTTSYTRRGENQHTVTKYFYDRFNNCIEEIHLSDTVDAYYRYSYDENGNCIKLSISYGDSPGNEEEYSDFEVFYIP